ncbi:hypothetical protein [Cerasicoccus fimbriatus]|uniref:hypothetical protein n=1 Tax=Cerasicoccus fimbriatus TaxID=3014554 RepID=UPI0022B32076|nr:hypothetical protein [Cerasicoccus sp. TK19100]
MINPFKQVLGTALLAACLVSTASAGEAPEIKVGAGKLVFDASGAVAYRSDQGEINLSVEFYAPGWSPRSQWKLGPSASSLESEGNNQWVWTNTFTQSGEVKAVLTEEVTATETGVTISYRLEKDPGFRFESASKGPHLEAVMPSASSSGQGISVAGKSVTLPDDNFWAYGDTVLFPAWGLDITSAERLSLSVWKVGGGGGSSVRFPLKETETLENGVVIYEGSFALN